MYHNKRRGEILVTVCTHSFHNIQLLEISLLPMDELVDDTANRFENRDHADEDIHVRWLSPLFGRIARRSMASSSSICPVKSWVR